MLKNKEDEDILKIVWAMYLSVCIARMKKNQNPLSSSSKNYISRLILLRACCEYYEEMNANYSQKSD
jgi:hypothetical protein